MSARSFRQVLGIAVTAIAIIFAYGTQGLSLMNPSPNSGEEACVTNMQPYGCESGGG
jgi:hypothetical protein